MLLLVDLEIVLGERQVVDARALDRIVHGCERVEVREVVAELPAARLRQPLAARARDRRAVVARATRAQRREDLVQRILADALLAPGRHFKTPRGPARLSR